ncbi:hypothetical protein ACH3VR_21900 [Microbacterium sp. B2969]|uniref:Cellulose biosynthesis protein BcsQ n=1 Tax=Microbacterium alkaliflavum TaxID=3248839 RepID=A0ABW7QEF6_9MICO
MAVIYLTSVSGSPGVTSATVGLALAWPRPVVLIEADIAKPSGILTGYLRGQVNLSHGLTPLSVQHQRGELTPNAVMKQTVGLGPNKVLVPGFSNINAAAGAGTSFWGGLGNALAAISAQGTDILIDGGRLGPRDDRAVLMQTADLVALVARPVIPDFFAIRARRAEVGETLARVGHDDWMGLLLIDAHDEAFTDAEVSKAVQLPVLGRLANDPRAAAVFSVGAEPTAKTKKSALTRDLTLLPNVLDQAIRERRNKLGAIPLEEVNA